MSDWNDTTCLSIGLKTFVVVVEHFSIATLTLMMWTAGDVVLSLLVFVVEYLTAVDWRNRSDRLGESHLCAWPNRVCICDRCQSTWTHRWSSNTFRTVQWRQASAKTNMTCVFSDRSHVHLLLASSSSPNCHNLTVNGSKLIWRTNKKSLIADWVIGPIPSALNLFFFSLRKNYGRMRESHIDWFANKKNSSKLFEITIYFMHLHHHRASPPFWARFRNCPHVAGPIYRSLSAHSPPPPPPPTTSSSIHF